MSGFFSSIFCCFPGKGFIWNPNAGALSQTAGKEETEIINSILLRDCVGHDNWNTSLAE
jgi:hypothetical protein